MNTNCIIRSPYIVKIHNPNNREYDNDNEYNVPRFGQFSHCRTFDTYINWCECGGSVFQNSITILLVTGNKKKRVKLNHLSLSL